MANTCKFNTCSNKTKSDEKQFCSRQCYYDFGNELIEKPCTRCKTLFFGKRSKSYCGKCKEEIKKERRQKKTKDKTIIQCPDCLKSRIVNKNRGTVKSHLCKSCSLRRYYKREAIYLRKMRYEALFDKVKREHKKKLKRRRVYGYL